MINRILVNREECEVRVAFLDGQTLVELHTEKIDDQTIVNNIYKGRVQDVVPGLQAAFIDAGLPRNMFLHFMDIRPESLVLGADDQIEAIRAASEQVMPGRIERKGRRPRLDPSQPQPASPVKKGDEIIVQVVKDEIGGKAPRVTTNLSLAGRYVVLLPFPSQDGGVSRKIAVGQDRFRLKKLLSSLRTEDYSFIVRTAGINQPEEAISKDAENLVKTWHNILDRYKRLKGPGLVHSDDDLIARLVRDAFPTEFDEVLCDDPADAEAIRMTIREILPAMADRVHVYTGVSNIFDHHGVEKQIDAAMDRKIWLKSGGYLIIDENEALTAIDVNTGRFTGRKDQEKTSLKTNLEACKVIAEQIRIRDIGGIIVIDFIDMLSRAHQEKVSEELRHALRDDRAKTAIGRIGDFGLMVLTRKRQRMSLQNQMFEECPYCKGRGMVLQPNEIFRRIKYDIRRLLSEDPSIAGLVIQVHPKFLTELTSRYARFLDDLHGKLEILYRPSPDMHLEDFIITPIKGALPERLRLPAARPEAEKRVGPVMRAEELSTDLVPHVTRRPTHDEDLYDEDDDDAADMAAPAAAAPTGAPAAEGDGTAGGRKRRRRRRRRGGGGQQQAAQPLPNDPLGDGPEDDEDNADLAAEDGATPEVAAEATPLDLFAANDADSNEDDDAPRDGETEAEAAARRRRRESSAERRARRRRARERRLAGEPVDETMRPPAPPPPPGVAPAPAAQEHGPEGREQQRNEPRDRHEQRADERPPRETPAQPVTAAPAPVAPAVAVPPAPVQPTPPPAPLPKLKLKTTRSAVADVLADVLTLVETKLENMEAESVPAPAGDPAPTPAEPVAPAAAAAEQPDAEAPKAARKPRPRRKAEAEAEPAKPAKPAAKPRATKKASPPAAETANPESKPVAKPAKAAAKSAKTPAKAKATTRSTKGTKTPKEA